MEVKLNELLKRTKARRRPGGRNWPHENTLTLEFLLGLLKKQGGKCYFTGVELEHDTNDKSKLISIDRLEPGLGYVEGNVALVSWLANQTKRDLRESEFINLCRLISALGPVVDGPPTMSQVYDLPSREGERSAVNEPVF